MNKNEIKKIAYVWNGLAYVHDDEIPPCACGGQAVASFTYNDKRFTSMEIHCRDCGMSTGDCKNEVEAISKWCNCFEDLERIREDAAAYQDEHYDDCLAFAGKCEYD